MKLAWRELIRRPSRFLTAGVALTLIVLLLLVLGGILDALIHSSTGLLRAQSAPLIVYSADSKGSIDRSRVTAERARGDRRRPRRARGHRTRHRAPGRPHRGSRGARRRRRVRLRGARTRGSRAAAARAGVRRPLARGRRARVWRQTIELGTARTPVEVIGWVSGTDYNLQSGLWVEPGHLAQRAERQHPGCSGRPRDVRGDPGHPRGRDVGRAGRGRHRRRRADRDGAHDRRGDRRRPGVSEQDRACSRRSSARRSPSPASSWRCSSRCSRSSGSGLLGVLKAIGASSRTLAAGLTLQARADRRGRLGRSAACSPSGSRR